MFQLLTKPDANPKTKKNLAHGVMTWVLHLAPGDLSGFEVCPRRTVGCTHGCINTSGRAGVSLAVQAARIGRTRMYFEHREQFMEALIADISLAKAYARKRGFQATFRLNATSDIPWHRIKHNGNTIFELFPHTQFYDYTKVAKRMLKEELPPNYHLTFSLAENNADMAACILQAGGNVAVVFRTKEMVAAKVGSIYVFKGGDCDVAGTIIDGDANDLRYLDPPGSIVALYAKGKARHDATGFVRDI